MGKSTGWRTLFAPTIEIQYSLICHPEGGTTEGSYPTIIVEKRFFELYSQNDRN